MEKLLPVAHPWDSQFLCCGPRSASGEEGEVAPVACVAVADLAVVPVQPAVASPVVVETDGDAVASRHAFVHAIAGGVACRVARV